MDGPPSIPADMGALPETSLGQVVRGVAQQLHANFGITLQAAATVPDDDRCAGRLGSR